MDPKAFYKMTYGLFVLTAREGAVVRSAAQLKSGDAIAVSLADGTAQCTVETVQRRNKRGKKEDI